MASYFDLDFGGAYSSSKEEYNHDDEMQTSISILPL